MEERDIMGPLQALYEAYIAKAEQLERDKKPTDGWFGLTKGPKDDPCHERFADDMKAFLADVAASEPGSAQLRQALAYIYRMPLEHPTPLTAYWMLQAVHSLTVDLIGRLDPSDAGALYEQYKADYPRRDRLPAHKKVLTALDKARK